MSTPVEVGLLKCDHGLRRQAIAESLLKEIVQGKLRSGEHLVTRALAQRFGVSHTPVREALVGLSGIGLVDLLPNRGAVVRRVSPRDIREICQVRVALECAAVRTACGRIDAGLLRDLDARLRGLVAAGVPDRAGFVAEARTVDSRLHDGIAASCRNAFLAKELGRLKILFRAFRDASWAHEEARNDYRRLAQEAREHLAIVEALLACDRARAVRAMADHIRSGMTYWSRALPRAAMPPRPTQAAEAEGEPR